MSFIRYKKRWNKWYVYEVTSFWNKATKKAIQTSRYLGVSDSNKGTYSKPGKRFILKREKQVLDFGDSYAIHELMKSSGFSGVLRKSFTNYDSLMTLITYQMSEGAAMYLCEDWIEGNIAQYIYPEARITSSSISKLLKNLGDEDVHRLFFRNYIEAFFNNKRGILIDSTALANSINVDGNAFGYTAEGIQKNIGCLMLVDKESKLPIYFRAIPGDIADVSTLRLTINEINRLGLKLDSAILDAGYFCEANVRYLCQQGINFVTRMPKSRNAFKELMLTIKDIECHANAVLYGQRVVFIKTQIIELYDNQMNAYILLDPTKRAAAIQNILKESNAEDLTSEQLDMKIKQAGIFVLLSKTPIDKQDILPTYYTRQCIEQLFGFAKSNNNILPLRVHSQQSIRGVLMLAFLALIAFAILRQRLMGRYTPQQALILLRTLKAKIYDSDVLITEPNKKVKNILALLNIMVPTSVRI